jgi:beta-1,4-mannosyl-glycoprotein beta-1,4-N-acetylglucosaminyltransferase
MIVRKLSQLPQSTLYGSLVSVSLLMAAACFLMPRKIHRPLIVGELPEGVFRDMHADHSAYMNVKQEIARDPNEPLPITMKVSILHFKSKPVSTATTTQSMPVQTAPVMEQNPCMNFQESQSYHREIFCLQDNVNVSQIFMPSKYGLCYLEGAYYSHAEEECKCREGWYGQYCSMPEAVEKSNYPQEYGTAIRLMPRRVIYAFPFTFEFEMLEARVAELSAVVDVFVILESNFTASGKNKPLYLEQNLQKGYLSSYQHKMLVLNMDHFPEAGRRNGWAVDESLRQYLGEQIFKRIPNLRPDDIVIINDADELLTWPPIFFLKFHNGFPEPVGMNLVHNVFGFFWQGDDLISHVFGACTVAMLSDVFEKNPYHLRSASKHLQSSDKLDDYKYRKSGRVREWSIGTKEKPAGWHCSWCFEPDRIRLKMISAHMGDVPRWGNDQRKTNVEYIARLIHNGTWFDDVTPLIPVNVVSSVFAPKHLQQHFEKYKHLLQKP